MHQLSSHTKFQSSRGGDFTQVMVLVAAKKRIPLQLLSNHSRCRAATARARQLAMYLAHVVYGHTMTEVGEAFGRDRTTVSHACALIEDMRDDHGFDAEVAALETELLKESGSELDHAH